jgi:hypothetical protein
MLKWGTARTAEFCDLPSYARNAAPNPAIGGRMKLRKPKATATSSTEPKRDSPEPDAPDKRRPNPPRTTTGWITSPKFGSAGSGGAELEPGVDVD